MCIGCQSDSHDLDAFLTVDEISGALKCEKDTVRAYIKKGDLKAVKLGREYRVSSVDYKSFIDSRRV